MLLLPFTILNVEILCMNCIGNEDVDFLFSTIKISTSRKIDILFFNNNNRYNKERVELVGTIENGKNKEIFGYFSKFLPDFEKQIYLYNMIFVLNDTKNILIKRYAFDISKNKNISINSVSDLSQHPFLWEQTSG